jgi:hypothetical protein
MDPNYYSKQLKLVTNEIHKQVGVMGQFVCRRVWRAAMLTSGSGNSAPRRRYSHFCFPIRDLGLVTNFMSNFYSHEMMVEVCCMNEAKY